MAHINHVIELFAGYSYLNKETLEMKANCSVTLIKGENKIILVKLFLAYWVESFFLILWFDYRLTLWLHGTKMCFWRNLPFITLSRKMLTSLSVLTATQTIAVIWISSSMPLTSLDLASHINISITIMTLRSILTPSITILKSFSLLDTHQLASLLLSKIQIWVGMLQSLEIYSRRKKMFSMRACGPKQERKMKRIKEKTGSKLLRWWSLSYLVCSWLWSEFCKKWNL